LGVSLEVYDFVLNNVVVSSSELVFPYHFFHAEVGFSGEGRWKTSDRAEDPTFEALNPVLAV